MTVAIFILKCAGTVVAGVAVVWFVAWANKPGREMDGY
jgi:hypothetical protein